MFCELAQSAPEELAALVRQAAITDTRLTYAAEILGRDVQDGALVIPALRSLLKNPSPVVREGAILGLSHHLTNEVRQALNRVAQEDPSPGVRETALDTLND